ncbi:uncharacterized protein LOC114265722 [Camellia sinensis]|uniref:uncharacterized protein LOC114265722 n=1 Tax=Camellia sinensis TaxID=4442 RepID=UPI00103648DD|nr:uncharacterized protein LOC114265722 [Camellia sinensis]XP_028062339.1 uncharacterized protein LOC114265722 [Camellia sinensis]
MIQPPGFELSTNAQSIYKLHNALYGLKQAPRAWYSTFSCFLLSQGFKNSKCDSSGFIKKTGSIFLALLVYVDDILVTGNAAHHIQDLVTQMHQAFSMKELRSISYFLGISVATSSSTTVLSQKKYAQDILTKAGMLDCKACSSPISAKPGLPPNSNLPFDNPSVYRSIVGALQYLTITRPDLSFAVNQLCQHMHNSTVGHYVGVKRLLRFIKGTISPGLTYTPSSFDLHAYSDSNWAGDAIDRKSTTSYCVFLGSNLISWSSKKQATVSRSSTEAKYRSLAHTAAELAWIGMLLQDFCIVPPTVPLLYCDNVSAIALASNPVFPSKSKHIEVDCHFVRDQVLANA